MPAPDVAVVTSRPIFPHGSLEEQRHEPTAMRDRQVWPRHMRETDHHQELRKTAGVKNHLRGMVTRDEMQTCYEHDYGIMTRPTATGRAGGADSDAPTSISAKTRRWPSYSPARLAGHHPRDVPTLLAEKDARPPRSSGSRSSRSTPRTQLGATDPSGTTPRSARDAFGRSTDSRLSAFADSAILPVAVRGWDDCQWHPRTHPHMVNGLSDHRIKLEQTTRIMKLRSSDLPFTTR